MPGTVKTAMLPSWWASVLMISGMITPWPASSCSAALKKLLSDTNVRGAVESFGQELAGKSAVKAEEIEQMIRSAETKFGIAQGKLNQPLRIAVTGSTIGAGIYETIELIGAEHSAERIRHALALEIH